MAQLNIQIDDRLYQHVRDCHKIANLAGKKISFPAMISVALENFFQFYELQISITEKNTMLAGMDKELKRVRRGRKKKPEGIDTD